MTKFITVTPKDCVERLVKEIANGDHNPRLVSQRIRKGYVEDRIKSGEPITPEWIRELGFDREYWTPECSVCGKAADKVIQVIVEESENETFVCNSCSLALLQEFNLKP